MFTESGRPPAPGSRAICGYCIRWGVPSTIRGEPGSPFDETFLRDSLTWPADLPICIGHDTSRVIGRLGEEATISADDAGLFITVAPPDYEPIEAVRCGAFKGWSVGFAAIEESWSTGNHGRRIRTINRAWLREVSLVTAGAHSTDLGLVNRPGIWVANKRADA